MNEDLNLIQQARQGNETALERLLTKYKAFANKIARRYFLAGQDEDDLFQEAMIGLFKAYQSFKPELNEEFQKFASICINRQIQTAVKLANRIKNKALNERVSLNNQGGYDFREEDDDEVLYFIIPSKEQLPDDRLISKEEIEEIKLAIISKLSTYEKRVLTLYLQGKSYKEMATMLKKETKSIENSLLRIKNKLSYLR